MSFLTVGALCGCACSGSAPEQAAGEPAADSYAASAQVVPKCAAGPEQLIDLGSFDPRPGLSDGDGVALNGQGTVVGFSSSADGNYHAFRWQADTGMVDLNPPCETSSLAFGINDHGEVVGSVGSVNGSSGHQRAVLWDAGNGLHELGTLGGSSSVAYRINNRGQVIGEADDTAGLRRPFIWDAQTGMTKIELPPHYGLNLGAINDSGVVVGTWFAPPGTSVAFKWTKEDGVTVLDQVGGSASEAQSINNNGDIAGDVLLNTHYVAVKWTACGTVRLPGPTSDDLRPLGSNDQGTIVGEERDSTTHSFTAVEWDPMQRFSVLPLHATAGVASDVNNCGDVSGERMVNDEWHPFLWHPARPAQ
ncbi:MAG TPA: DUF3466 family protein [Polyangiaceae bacterium]|nr:DUF3466 family protein [Polyangiaceae bacterium]